MSAAFVVAQLGARMHYGVARALALRGRLERLYTDICSVKGWPRMLRAVPKGLLPASARRLRGRAPDGVPAESIPAFTAFGREYAARRNRARTPTEATAEHLRAGGEFCDLVLGAGLGSAAGVYAFNSAALELLLGARERGLLAVVEQTIAPREVEAKLLRREREAFPHWAPENSKDDLTDEFAARERAEWDAAALVLCGSEFVRRGIAACGGPADRCRIVPYGIDGRFRVADRRSSAAIGGCFHDRLRVLTVGEVGLRKGSPYLLDAAKRTAGLARFRMVGSCDVPRRVKRELGAHVELIGPVPRPEMRAQYEWADVFALPSSCEGSATVAYEALAAGLPVICTPNTGSVVRDGFDGFIVPVRDADALAERIALLAERRERLEGLSANAARTAGRFTLEAYAGRLLGALDGERDTVRSEQRVG